MRQIMWLAIALTGCTGSTEVDAGFDADPSDGGRDALVEACLNGMNGGMIGDECNCQRDCEAGLTCALEDDVTDPGYGPGWPHGTCTRLCTVGSDECGEGNLCPTSGGTMSLCRRTCTSSDECRTGWLCIYGQCQPHCVDDSECLSGHCDPHLDLCTDGSAREGGTVEEQCTRDEDCLSRVCFQPIGGHCLELCDGELDDCVDGAICVPGLTAEDRNVGICMIECTTTADCPGQLECLRDGTGRMGCWVRN